MLPEDDEAARAAAAQQGGECPLARQEHVPASAPGPARAYLPGARRHPATKHALRAPNSASQQPRDTSAGGRMWRWRHAAYAEASRRQAARAVAMRAGPGGDGAAPMRLETEGSKAATKDESRRGW